MPQALFVQIGLALANGVGQFLIVNSAILSSGALLLGSLALSARQRAKAKRQARDAYNAGLRDRYVNIRSTQQPRGLGWGPAVPAPSGPARPQMARQRLKSLATKQPFKPK